MLKSLTLIFAFIFASAISLFAQSTCSCTQGNGGCSSNQSCPTGYVAVCTCSATGCGGQCNKQDGDPPEEGQGNRLQSNLKNADIKNVGEILSKGLGMSIKFQASPYVERLSIPGLDSGSMNHWDILEYLADNGAVTINGQPLEIWKGWRTTLLNGGEFQICSVSASARMLLREINFITGRHYKIVAGDPLFKVTGQIKGGSLQELLESLSRQASIKISEK